jgi:hypothetical protein
MTEHGGSIAEAGVRFGLPPDMKAEDRLARTLSVAGQCDQRRHAAGEGVPARAVADRIETT